MTLGVTTRHLVYANGYVLRTTTLPATFGAVRYALLVTTSYA